jgi:hypothetical protein
MDETARLGLLRRYDILDTPPEAAFDHIVALAARVLDMPVSLLEEPRAGASSRGTTLAGRVRRSERADDRQ